MSGLRTFAVTSHRRFLGYVNGSTHREATRAARILYSDHAESLELDAVTRVRPADIRSLNKGEQAKRTRRYTDAAAFEARRAAAIAEYLG